MTTGKRTRRPIARRRAVIALLALVVALASFTAMNTNAATYGHANLALVTMGGQEFWTDRTTRAGWRIQCHALTGHCRLLDPDNVRRGWGTFADVMAELGAVGPAARSENATRHVVVLVHGMGGNAWTFWRLRKILRSDGYEVIDFTYASALTRLPEQADALRSYVAGLDNAEEITFVAHSMGGLVVDRALSRGPVGRHDLKVAGVVRLGTPNAGSSLARRAVAFADPAARKWTPIAEVAMGLPPRAISNFLPHCDIAGSLGNGLGVNPWVPGDDDGIVGVAEVSRNDLAKTLVVNASHFGLTSDLRVTDAIRHFIRTGKCELASENGGPL